MTEIRRDTRPEEANRFGIAGTAAEATQAAVPTEASGLVRPRWVRWLSLLLAAGCDAGPNGTAQVPSAPFHLFGVVATVGGDPIPGVELVSAAHCVGSTNPFGEFCVATNGLVGGSVVFRAPGFASKTIGVANADADTECLVTLELDSANRGASTQLLRLVDSEWVSIQGAAIDVIDPVNSVAVAQGTTLADGSLRCDTAALVGSSHAYTLRVRLAGGASITLEDVHIVGHGVCSAPVPARRLSIPPNHFAGLRSPVRLRALDGCGRTIASAMSASGQLEWEDRGHSSVSACGDGVVVIELPSAGDANEPRSVRHVPAIRRTSRAEDTDATLVVAPEKLGITCWLGAVGHAPGGAAWPEFTSAAIARSSEVCVEWPLIESGAAVPLTMSFRPKSGGADRRILVDTSGDRPSVCTPNTAAGTGSVRVVIDGIPNPKAFVGRLTRRGGPFTATCAPDASGAMSWDKLCAGAFVFWLEDAPGAPSDAGPFRAYRSASPILIAPGRKTELAMDWGDPGGPRVKVR